VHDSRKLGRELDLFDTGPPDRRRPAVLAARRRRVRHTLEEYIRDVERRRATAMCTPPSSASGTVRALGPLGQLQR